MSGTAEKPRISVYRSNKYFYAQVIDDTKSSTIVSASSLKSGKNINLEVCKGVAKDLAKKMKDAKLEAAVFDRNGYVYTGKLKAFADELRENGIKI